MDPPPPPPPPPPFSSNSQHSPYNPPQPNTRGSQPPQRLVSPFQSVQYISPSGYTPHPQTQSQPQSPYYPHHPPPNVPHAYVYPPLYYQPPPVYNPSTSVPPSVHEAQASRKRRLTSAESSERRPSGPSGYSGYSGYSGSATPAGPSTYTQVPNHAAYVATQRPSIAAHRNSRDGTSPQTAIDLTGSAYSYATPSFTMQSSLVSPIPPQSQGNNQTSGTGEFALPSWQPDSEVTHCFVCRNQFSFFFRKHHCRRCGRVVCANCSPHRITLPRQFIVQQPPSETELQDEEGSSMNQYGGAEVRVCNPCVPDPNYNPPLLGSTQGINPGIPSSSIQYPQQWTMPPGSGGSYQPNESSRVFVGASGRTYNWPTRPTGHRTSYSATNLPRTPQYDPSNRGYAIPRGGGHGAPVAIHVPQTISHSQRPPGAYQGSMIPQDLSSFFNPNNPAQASSSRDPPRPQIAEEDECPVCGEELPAKGQDGDMTSREAHIESCLQSHMYSSSAPQGKTGQFEADDGQAPEATENPPESPFPGLLTNPRVRRMTRGHMLVYTATEKDCIGQDGVAQECVICLEDFEVKEEMARLECLCKFHRVCTLYFGSLLHKY
jgi:hypothetical protein